MVTAFVSEFVLCWGPLTVLTFLTVSSRYNTRLSCGRYIANLMANANCAAKRQSLENCTEFFSKGTRGEPGGFKKF